MKNTTHRHLQVAIAGAGFAGIGAAIRLSQEGIDDYLVFERAHDVGGVWRDNSYPGCACDVQSHLYCFSFAPNPDWSRSYSPQAEIHAYLRRCAEQFGVLPRVRFGHTIREAAWDAHAQRWRIETSHGTFTADVLIGAVGALSEPSVPELPGLDRFGGKVFHSARWDHDYPLAGKRVAVIGTGASAIQFVPQIQPTVGKLSLFQRTPPWIVPREDFAYSEQRKQLLRRSRLARAWTRGAIYASREWMATAFLNPRIAAFGEKMALRNLARQVPDPVLREKLTPRYRLGCKRVLVSNDYLPSLTQPNVELVTEGIAEVRPNGIVTADGVEHEVDAIIFGTGFTVTEMPFARHVRGRDGRTLTEVWDGSMRAHLGTTVAGFPNFFLVPGPNSGLAHTSIILMIEAQLEHVMSALRFLRRRSLASVEPRVDAQDKFIREIDRKMEGTVWTSGGCKSWYLDRTGRNSTLWPGYTFSYRRRVKRFRPEEYVAEAHRAQPVKRTLGDRLQLAIARGLGALPPSLQLRLLGGAPLVLDGLTLATDVQLILAVQRAQKVPSLAAGEPHQARGRMRRGSKVGAGVPTRVRAVRTFAIDGAAGPLRARHYTPGDGANAPLLLFFHGGGFVLGDLDTHDEICRMLCRHAGVHVLSVDYRLAPEHRFPAAVDDALAAYDWAREHAATLGAHPGRIAVSGDSAGGNLATVVAQQAARTGRPQPALQLLLYPVVDRSRTYPSVELFGEGLLLESADMEKFAGYYLEKPHDGDPRVDPGLARDLSGLAPALVITAGFDPLRDEGEAYAARLREAGVAVTHRRFDALIHGFGNLTGVSRSCREAMLAVAADTRALLDGLDVADQGTDIGDAQLAGRAVHVERPLRVDGEASLAR